MVFLLSPKRHRSLAQTAITSALLLLLCNFGCRAVIGQVRLSPKQGRISLTILDERGNQIASRAWVDSLDDSGRTIRRYFQPDTPDSVAVYSRDRSFSCDGQFTMLLPAGPARVHVEKGKEFRRVEQDVVVSANKTTSIQIVIPRWINMPARRWYSADMHVHFGNDDIGVLRQLALADDVHVVPAFTYWLRGTESSWRSSWPDAEYEKTIRIDPTHLVSRNHLEIERISRCAVPGGSVGATFLFHLRKPISVEHFGEHFPTDAQLSRIARRESLQCVIDSDKPSWAETVIGAALDGLDTIQVCHNHYHRMQTIPGGWGMIGPLVSGESNTAAGDGLFHRTNALYYRLLNCGFRLGVSGGSAIGVMPVPTGYNRVYAKVDGELTSESFWSSIKAGRSFATSGPMINMTVDGHSIGSTILRDADDTEPIEIRALVEAIDSLEALQIVVDGRVVESRSLLGKSGKSGKSMTEQMHHTIVPSASSWVAARALFRAPDGLLRQAHTSPSYVQVDNKPCVRADDVRYMLRWIDQLKRLAEQRDDWFPDRQVQENVLATYEEAAAVYRRRLASADQ